jgi:O-antigen/teichoic acid export membrane protein
VAYAKYPMDFVLIAIAGALNFPLYFGGVALAAARAFHVQMYSGVASCLAAFVGALLLIRPYGITGAAINTSIAGAISLVVYVVGLYFAIQRRRLEPDASRSLAVSNLP